MAFTPITITLDQQQPNQGASQGTVTVTLSEPIQNTGVSVDPTPIVGNLNAEGQLVNSLGDPFIIVANDDTDTSPEGSYYSFTLELDSAPLEHFDAIVSHTVADGTVDMSALRPTL